MTTEDEAEPSHPLDDVPDRFRHELVRLISAADRDENREIYDALEDE